MRKQTVIFNIKDLIKIPDYWNQAKARVESVKDYLTSHGINKTRVKTKAFGGTMPLSRDNTPEAHRLNRRVELRILEN